MKVPLSMHITRTGLFFRICRSVFVVTSVLSLLDYLENSNFLNINKSYSSYKFLLFTKISLFMTLVTSLLGIIHRLTLKFRKVYFFFLPIAITFEIIVTVVYWGLVFYDEKLIVDPQTLMPGMETPFISRAASHIFPLILGFIEARGKILHYNDYHIMFFVLFALFYYIAVTLYANAYGIFVYPFLEKFGSFGRLLFMASISGVATLIYLLLAKKKAKKAKMRKNNK